MPTSAPFHSTPQSSSTLKHSNADILVRVAARALGRAGLAHAYGHCSQRLDDDSFLVCAPRPMGLINTGDAGTIVAIEGPLPDGVLGEVSIHQKIYASRPEIGGVCRTMPPNIMALSTLGQTPRSRHGLGTYFAPEMPLWDDPQLIRSTDAAHRVVETMSDNNGVVMRGNGLVTAAEDVSAAVVLNWYAEDSARIELAVLASGKDGILINEEEAQQRATRGGKIFERMWEYLTSEDPEIELLTNNSKWKT